MFEATTRTPELAPQEIAQLLSDEMSVRMLPRNLFKYPRVFTEIRSEGGKRSNAAEIKLTDVEAARAPGLLKIVWKHLSTDRRAIPDNIHIGIRYYRDVPVWESFEIVLSQDTDWRAKKKLRINSLFSGPHQLIPNPESAIEQAVNGTATAGTSNSVAFSKIAYETWQYFKQTLEYRINPPQLSPDEL